MPASLHYQGAMPLPHPLRPTRLRSVRAKDGALDASLDARRRYLTGVAVVAAMLAGCATKATDFHYYRALVDGQVNYYRVAVHVRGTLTKAEVRQGWYPSAAVDAALGEVTSAAETSARDTETKVRKQIDEAIISTNAAYLVEAAKETPDPAKLRALLLARQNVRRRFDDGATDELMEYDPVGELDREHSNSKFIIVLSSDPDEIIDAIARFAEDDKTSATIGMLADTIVKFGKRSDEEAATASDVAGEGDAALVSLIDAALGTLGQSSGAVLGTLQALGEAVSKP
ncbi:MAG: hypothetical protein IPH07_32580 [Deltaproteobacteria bacterium]|nr:hypothetical protein [Deltaproteobacteria bacterium]MBP7285264.1 hypothetical protein [Nannocystaceae bacterium]